MFVRAGLVWVALLLVAVMNGAVRVAWIIPRVGEYGGHVISTLALSLLILIVAALTIDWIAPASAADALQIGLVWVGLTLAFELVAGHYLLGQSWQRLLADYDIAHGRIWVLVLMTTFVAPALGRQLGG